MHATIRNNLLTASDAIAIAKTASNPRKRALNLKWAIADLIDALAAANRHARHLRSSIMRALNFARAALRNISK